MTNPPATASGLALIIGANVRAVLKSQGRDLTWLATQIDVSVDRVLTAFRTGVPAWMTLDMANVLDVNAGTLLDGPARA